MGQDLGEYQKWVDYDMKRYHKISDKTMGEIKKAGLSVVKDQYGAYEVIAKEPVREAVKNRRIREQVSDEAYEVAEILKKEFTGKDKVSYDDFNKAFSRATKKVLGRNEIDSDFETDVRSILSMSGFETEFEGDNEGGLSKIKESCEKGKKYIKEGYNSTVVITDSGYVAYGFGSGDKSEKLAQGFANDIASDPEIQQEVINKAGNGSTKIVAIYPAPDDSGLSYRKRKDESFNSKTIGKSFEPVREAVKNVDPRMPEYMKKLVDVYSNDLDYKSIVEDNFLDSTVDEFFDNFIDGQTEKRHPKIDEFAYRIVEQGYDDRHMWKESITDKLSNIGNTHNYITPMAFGFEYFINGGEDLLVDVIGNKNNKMLVQIVSDKVYYEVFRALRGYYRTAVIELIKYAQKASTDGKSGLDAIKDGSITYTTAQFDEDVEYFKEILNPKHIASFFKYADVSTKDNKDLIGSLISYLGINSKTIRESHNKGKKTIKEYLKIIMDINDYHPWSGAVDTFDKIQDADMVGALEDYLEDIYPEGLTVTELNDILWFDGDTVLRDLGLSDEEEDEDEDEEDIDESCKKSVKEGRSIDFKKLHRCKK